MRLQDVIIVILLILGAWKLGTCNGKQNAEFLEVPADTVYSERIVPRDRVVEKPIKVVEYREVVNTDTVFVEVPTDFQLSGVIDSNPISFTRGDVRLTYFDPLGGRYVEQVFDAPKKRFQIGVRGYIGYQYLTPDMRYYTAGVMTGLEYRQFGILVMPAYGAAGLTITVGLTYKIL